MTSDILNQESTETHNVNENMNNNASFTSTSIKEDIKSIENYIDNISSSHITQIEQVCPKASSNFNFFYERLILDLRSEINFLRSQLTHRENCYREEVIFLREQLKKTLDGLHMRNNNCCTKERRHSNFNSSENFNSIKMKGKLN